MKPESLSHFAQYPSLKGRSVFVTGGSSGIGGDIVIAFARQGAQVAFTGRNAEAAQQVIDAAKALGPEPLFLQSDAADVDALKAAIATAAARFGDITVLVNNVANDQRHELSEVTADDFDWRVSVNLRPDFFAAQAVVDGMKRSGGGAIVNLGSTSWKIKGKGYPAVRHLEICHGGADPQPSARAGRVQHPREHAHAGLDHDGQAAGHVVDEAGERAMKENHCLPGRILGADVANMALFLSAADSGMVTAQDFVVDAGWT